jgi:hypothetical protein
MGELLSRADVAQRLGISPRTMRRVLAGIPALACYRIGRDIRFNEDDAKVITAFYDEIRSGVRKLPAEKRAAPNLDLPAPLAVTSSEDDIIAVCAPWPKTGCGIYFLTYRKKIVYVGQAKNVGARLAAHAVDKKFTGWHWIRCPERHLDAMERAYIDKFLPELNRDWRTRRLKSSKEKPVARAYG